MKVNEAPEKIYIDDFGSELSFDWHTEHSYEKDIEYTRTDAFIEKAENYLKNQFIKDVSVLAGGVVNINFSTAIKEFVKYMKGE